ncbi:MAG: DUF4198 domain-containing protein [Marinoscillum sp.]|uniref:DUF4198 domain-containing protein n=1 Tax=Marinoscillum sp. TaxID=2024838 RepID=UPI0032FAFCB3
MHKSKTILTLALVLMACAQSFAHYMWLETSESGALGKAHIVKVYFGEYTYGVVEDPAGENFAAVKNFRLWVVMPSGRKERIETQAKGDAFQGVFTPAEKGTYTVVLNNDEIDVIDYTQYDFGIFKTHYHSTARVLVGDENQETNATNDKGLVVVNNSEKKAEKGADVNLKVVFKGRPLADQEVVIYVADLWSKKLTTDENGLVTFTLPWAARYTVETTKKEEVPGTYHDEEYEFIWHCATYAIAL